MNPTEILKSEHRVIEQVLECLEKIGAEARSLGRLDAEAARDAIDFFRNFADRCHHGKEEAHLFPAMEAKGFPREGGPTGVMLHEHEQGRAYIRAMDETVERAAAGHPAAVTQFCAHAQGYVDLLREHISKEDHCLFGLADRALSPTDQDRLLEQFERVESEHMGEGTHQRFLDVANRLADRYGVARAQSAGAGPEWACGHH
jgi:hemerythrin-like domain-containing protein